MAVHAQVHFPTFFHTQPEPHPHYLHHHFSPRPPSLKMLLSLLLLERFWILSRTLCHLLQNLLSQLDLHLRRATSPHCRRCTLFKNDLIRPNWILLVAAHRVIQVMSLWRILAHPLPQPSLGMSILTLWVSPSCDCRKVFPNRPLIDSHFLSISLLLAHFSTWQIASMDRTASTDTITFFKRNITKSSGRMRNLLLARPRIGVSLAFGWTSLTPLIHVRF